MNAAKNKRHGFELKAQASEETAELWIYDQIGEDFFGEGTTAKSIAAEIAELDAERLDVHINSPGGSVFDGQAIYNAVRRYPGTVTSYIDGIAASIASVIAEAGEHVVMASNALFMIHDPFGLAIGSADVHRRMADSLDKCAETIAGVYQAKSGLEREAIIEAMHAETWYTAEAAKEAGFVDEIDNPVPMEALAGFDLDAYHNVPKELAEASADHASGGLAAEVRQLKVALNDLNERDTAGKAAEESPAEAAEAPLCRDKVYVPGLGFRTFKQRG